MLANTPLVKNLWNFGDILDFFDLLFLMIFEPVQS